MNFIPAPRVVILLTDLMSKWDNSRRWATHHYSACLKTRTPFGGTLMVAEVENWSIGGPKACIEPSLPIVPGLGKFQ